MNTLSYDYKPKLWLMLLVVAFFGACAAVVGNVALTNDRGLILNRIIEFSQSSATIFYWAVCIVAVGFVVIGCIGIITSLRTPKKVVLGDTSISAPKSHLSKNIVTIPYDEIVDIIDQTVQKQVFLIVQGNQKKVTIARSSMASKEKFTEMRSALIERISREP